MKDLQHIGKNEINIWVLFLIITKKNDKSIYGSLSNFLKS